MANLYDPVNRVNVGDPTLKSHYDQLLQNAVVLALTTGRVIARAGLMASWNDQVAWTPMAEGFQFKLPAATDCLGLTIRLAGYMEVEASGQTGSVRLEYFDGAAWVAVANSALAWSTSSFNNPLYLESVNLQSNLFMSETLYRFTASVAVGGYRMRGIAFLTSVG